MVRDDPIEPITFGLWFSCFTVEKMHCAGLDNIDKAFPQIFAKTGGMYLRNADVLIKMEHRCVVPVNCLICGQCCEEIKLGCPRRDDETGMSVGIDRRAQLSAGDVCRCFACFLFGCCFKNIHLFKIFVKSRFQLGESAGSFRACAIFS